MAISIVYKSGTISAGQSLSSAIDCTTGAPVILFMPALWTPAQLTYQVSYDGAAYFDLFDRLGKELAVNIAAGTAVRLNPEWTDSVMGGWLKVRSGARQSPVVQTADRVFTLMINTNV
jgi:hypothetical protein